MTKVAYRPGLWGIETEAQQLASLITRALPVTVASVALCDESSLTLTVKAVDTVRPVDGSLSVGVRVSLSDAPWHRIAFEQSEPILLESGDDQQRAFEREADLALIPDVRSMYLLPIRFAEETVGVLVLGEARAITRERFSSEKRQRCQTILDEFVAATAHAWEARRLRRQVRAMSSLMQLVRGVSTARSFDDVLISLAAEVADWLGIPVRAALLGLTGREIRLLARWQLPDETLSDGGRQMFLAMTRSGVLDSGPVVVTVAGDDPLDPLAAVEPAAKNWTRIGVPLMWDEQLIGIACLYVEDEVRLADWELEAIRRRGEITAVGVTAVEITQAHEAEEQWLQRLALALLTSYRRALVGEVFNGLAQTLPMLLRSRLQTLFALGLESPGSALAPTTAIVEEVSTALSEIWAPNGRDGDGTMPIEVNQAVLRAVRIASLALEEASRGGRPAIELRVELSAEPLFVRGSPAIVGVIVHVIENAVEAMPEGGQIYLRTSRGVDDDVTISVTDTGLGLDEDSRQRAFAPFFSRKGKSHPGLGLSVVQALTRRYGGDAMLSSGTSGETVLLIRLPLISNAIQPPSTEASQAYSPESPASSFSWAQKIRSTPSSNWT